ncbi:leucine-rich repeat-containing G-protein coupled receptor 5-like [Colias croceus]|uniref:leucine-rich repeat-containing G-protein coupled receptor 5-like n=1 Tax=Colias crocea TaxID=72248 RepID=UPI001E27D225|nr:leucine-rich repeat-containing G-protein coupled receptor 5-like [Colias croceus]
METATIVFILIMVPMIFGDCPYEKIRNMGHCHYNIHCTHDIKGIKIQRECQGSTNYDVILDVTLVNATDRFDTTSELDFLSMITSLKISGNWPETNLTFLENMYRIKTLHLIDNQIKRIFDSPFRHLNRLENLNLSRNHLTDIEELFQFDSYPNKVKKLSLSHNNIQEIPGDTFSELTNLIELDLSFNQISELYEEPFYNLTNLETLRLNNNLIKNLNGAMNNLLNLKHLYLRVNQIQNIDIESIKVIYHLETFDISQNQLENLKPIMFSRHWYHFGDHSVCKIILSENHITYVPNATVSNEIGYRTTRNLFKQRMDVFTELDLSQNSISHIEYNAFQSIVQLTSLDISCNRLITFDINAKDLRYVKYLNLSQNYLQTLHYKSFAAMINLQNLDLSHNNMDYFPDQPLSNNYRLKLLNFTFNDIVQINSLRISFNREGGILDLSNNGLSYLNLPTGDAIGLTILILSSNNITEPSLIKLNHQPDLVQLDMSKNLIQELDKSSLQLPVTLGLLDLSTNYIQRIGPSSFHRVPHLKTLRLSYNFLTGIDYGTFEGLTSLLNLDLAHNKITHLDSKVLMDLKMLSVLSLRDNGLTYLDHSNWLSHKQDLRVYLDDNEFSCDWLATALNDFNNGYSKMRPTVLNTNISGNSIEGIPCKQEVGNLIQQSPNFGETDERLLVINQKILEAVQEQTSFLRKNIWRFVLQDAERNSLKNNN